MEHPAFNSLKMNGMPTLLKTLNNHVLIEFDKGNFDEWCIYVTKNGNKRYPPLDVEYFYRLQELSKIYSAQKIYNDFLKIYLFADKTIIPNVLKLIDLLSNEYGEHAEEMNIWFTVIYAGMVAEENKEHAVLKKRIKRLGMHQLLVENVSPDFAANFSKGKKWRDLDVIMKALGF
ncbi:DUF7004 family protein [Pedobacter jejuensis]|uniref:Uncharacterized protein n=1 Tax=Pedobacter jejuensis TaxID=1268550 RepID=A0A3N0BY89_9SPHI|nr:hypothetical protein [Pedobacter jejuensis]RNL54285.1 hypothetical protein D7004_09360 [Pedobacter jejuensis]